MRYLNGVARVTGEVLWTAGKTASAAAPYVFAAATGVPSDVKGWFVLGGMLLGTGFGATSTALGTLGLHFPRAKFSEKAHHIVGVVSNLVMLSSVFAMMADAGPNSNKNNAATITLVSAVSTFALLSLLGAGYNLVLATDRLARKPAIEFGLNSLAFSGAGLFYTTQFLNYMSASATQDAEKMRQANLLKIASILFGVPAVLGLVESIVDACKKGCFPRAVAETSLEDGLGDGDVQQQHAGNSAALFVSGTTISRRSSTTAMAGSGSEAGSGSDEGERDTLIAEDGRALSPTSSLYGAV